MLRVLHTSDWHLGHTLHGVDRAFEHERFLGWLLDLLGDGSLRPDVLLHTGDLFDGANPPSASERMWYEFVVEARRRRPDLSLVLVAGNHDSPARLEAPSSLLRSMGVSVVGRLPLQQGNLDPQRLLVSLANGSGEVGALCVAVPFLRTADLPPVAEEGLDPLIEGVRRVYRRAIQEALLRRRPGQALIATGHCYLTGTQISELSERKILGGNQHALPLDLFPPEVAYVALGHLHLPQQVGPDPRVQYAGSPIPLSMEEASYPHRVLVVDFEGESLASVRSISVPRAVDILRLPREGPLPLEVALDCLARELPFDDPDGDPRRRPLLEVRIFVDRPGPDLREKVQEVVKGRAVRLVRIARHRASGGKGLAESEPERALGDLSPDEVLKRCWEQQCEGAPLPEGLLRCFLEAVDAAYGTPTRS